MCLKIKSGQNQKWSKPKSGQNPYWLKQKWSKTKSGKKSSGEKSKVVKLKTKTELSTNELQLVFSNFSVGPSLLLCKEHIVTIGPIAIGQATTNIVTVY